MNCEFKPGVPVMTTLVPIFGNRLRSYGHMFNEGVNPGNFSAIIKHTFE